MKLLLAIVIVVIIVGTIYRFSKDGEIFNPVLVFIVPLAFSFIINIMYYDTNGTISDVTYSIYIICILSIVAGLIAGMKSKLIIFGKQTGDLAIKNQFVYCLCWIIAIIMAIYAIKYMATVLGMSVGIGNIILNMRWYSVHVYQGTLWPKYGMPFATVIFTTLIYQKYICNDKSKRINRLLLIDTFLVIIFFMLNFARTIIIGFLFEVIFIYWVGLRQKSAESKRRAYISSNLSTNKGKKQEIRILVILLCVLVALFSFIAYKTNKMRDSSNRFWLISYFGEEFTIFDQRCVAHPNTSKSLNSFGILGRVISKFGIINSNVSTVADPNIPNDGKVSSFISIPYGEVGLIGCILIFLVYGLLIGYIYKMYQSCGGIWIFVYSTCIYQLFMAFYAFQFGMSSQVYELVLYFLLFKTFMGNTSVV